MQGYIVNTGYSSAEVLDIFLGNSFSGIPRSCLHHDPCCENSSEVRYSEQQNQQQRQDERELHNGLAAARAPMEPPRSPQPVAQSTPLGPVSSPLPLDGPEQPMSARWPG
jgi:hypothetical protein